MMMSEWFASEDFWIKTFPFMFEDQRMDSAEDEVHCLLESTGIEQGRVLDLCCGPGRHSLPLARRGFQVTAVDGSAFLIQKARDNAREEGLEIEWVRKDMREFVRPDAFDLALNLFTSFGYFQNQADDERVLRNLFESLKPGGLLAMDLVSKENLAMRFEPTTSERLPDGSRLIQCHEIIHDWNAVRNEWILVRDGKAESFFFDLRLYSGEELRRLLLLTGFSEVRLFGDMGGGPFDAENVRLFVLARKP